MDTSETLALGRVEHAGPDANEEFVALYRATFRRIYAYVRAQVPDAETAEELTSRVFLKAFESRARTPEGDRSLFWLFRVARTTVIDYYRTDRRRRLSNVSLEATSDLAAAGADPEARLLARERSVRLLGAIGALGQAERELLVLKFACRQTNQEIGDTLGASPAAVSMRLVRALRHLKRRLEGSDIRP